MELFSPMGVVPITISLLPILYAVLLALGSLLISMFRPSVIKKGIILLWRQKVIILVVAAGISGIVFAKRALFPAEVGFVSAAENTDADWPLFRGGPARRGVAPGSADPVSGGIVWGFTDERTFFSSPAVVGNRVYATSAIYETFKNTGSIYCLDADTGGQVWKVHPDGFRATFSSPAISGKYLVSGEGLHYTRDARVVCLDLEQDGKILWSYRTKSHVESTPCLINGRVYIGAGDDGYYCFELEPGADGQAQVVWHVSGEKYADAETSPAVLDGRVYIGLGMGGRAICCLDADSGEELWRVPTPCPVFGPPTLAKGKVFVGMGNGNFVESAEQVMGRELEKLKQEGATEEQIEAARINLRPVGEVWCMDAESGEVEWKHTVGRTVLGAIAAGDKHLYFGSRDEKLYTLTYEGKEVHTWDAHSPILTSPALNKDHIYVVTGTGRLFGIDLSTMEPVWETLLGTTGPFLSSPTVARGHVYVGSQDDGLLCLGQQAGKREAPIWSGFLGGSSACGWVEQSPLAQRGAFRWRFPGKPEGEEVAERLQVAAPLVCLEDAMYVSVQGNRMGMVRLAHDPKASKTPKETWFFATPHPPRGSPVANAKQIFFVDGGTVDGGTAEVEGTLYALDAVTGESMWSRSLGLGATGRLVLARTQIFVEDQPGTLSCLDLDGKEIWSRDDMGTLAGPVCVTESMVLAARKKAPSLIALDRPTGRTLWEAQAGPATTGPAVHKGQLYVGTPEGLKVYRLSSGEELWHLASGAVAHAVALLGSQAAYVTADGTLIVVDTEAQEILKEIPKASAQIAPVLCRDGVLYAGSRDLYRWGFDDPEPKRWLKTSWLGTFTSPLLMDRSCIYFGTSKRGLVCARGKER